MRDNKFSSHVHALVICIAPMFAALRSCWPAGGHLSSSEELDLSQSGDPLGQTGLACTPDESRAQEYATRAAWGVSKYTDHAENRRREESGAGQCAAPGRDIGRMYIVRRQECAERRSARWVLAAEVRGELTWRV